METSYHPRDLLNETEIKSTTENTDIDQIKNTLPQYLISMYQQAGDNLSKFEQLYRTYG